MSLGSVQRMNPAYQSIILDMLLNVLDRAKKPSEYATYVASQMRMMTGAKHVVCVLHNESCRPVSHQVISTVPARRHLITDHKDFDSLIQAVYNEDSPVDWNLDEATPAELDRTPRELLRKLDCPRMLALPLRVEDERTGSLLMLGLPSEAKRSSILDMAEPITMLTASLLQSCLAYENMEMLVEQRTVALSESHQMYRRLVDNLHEGILVLDSDRKVTYVNDSIVAILGTSYEGILGKTFDELVESPEPISWDRIFKRANMDESFSEEFEIRTQYGEDICVLVHIAPQNKDKRFGGWQVVMVDVTARKRTFEALESAKLAAEEASRAKSGFLANMSHEIRTPLNVIIGYGDLLVEEIDDPRLQDRAEAIRVAGQSLLSLINDVLDFSKIESKKIHLRPAPFDLVKLFEEIRLIFSQQATGKGIELDVRMPMMSYSLSLDGQRLRQVIFNLIGNAVKFTEKGYVRLSVESLPAMSGEEDCCDLEFIVEDTGIGIPVSKHSRIFDPFEQSGENDLVQRCEGTGLGLAICKQIVEMMGSRIDLVSDLGEGSRFSFRLHDVLQVNRLADQKVEVKERLKYEPTDILVVDDLKLNREVLAAILKPMGFKCEMAESGVDAINKLDGYKPQVILMDVIMPEMNGIEATRRIREMSQFDDVPIVAVTASGEDEDHIDLSGFDHVVLKPVTRPALTEVLSKYVERVK